MSDDDRFATALRDAWAGPRLGCPAPESLLPAELAALSDDERRRVEEHVRSCPACAAEAELAAAFERGEGAASDDVRWIVGRLESERGATSSAGVAASRGPRAISAPSPSGSSATVVPIRPRRPSRIVLPLAAAIAIALGSALVLREIGFDGAPSLPDRRAGDVVRGGFVDAVAPRGDLVAAPDRFEWTTVDGATFYRVTVLAVDGTVVWSSTPAAGTSVASPAELLASLLTRVRYRWRVDALDAAGALLAASDPADFVIRPVGAGSAP